MYRFSTLGFTIIITVLTAPSALGWLYTRPEGDCPKFQTCHSCVVEYARDFGVPRRVCTWCPATGSCEMMNQWSETCSTGQTYRESCRIVATDLPRCIFFTHSYWICFNAFPTTTPDQCGVDFANNFCTPQTLESQVQLCNGDSLVLETVATGFGPQDALVVTKNGYGLEVNMKYFWFNAGYGEDRRRLETTSSPTEEKWLCNANLDPDQSAVLKYQLHQEPRTDDDDDGGGDENGGGSSAGATAAMRSVSLTISILLAVLFAAMLPWTEEALFSLFCCFIDCKTAQEAVVLPYQRS